MIAYRFFSIKNVQKPVTRWQRMAAFCQRESKSWLRVLRWPPASKSHRRLQSPAAHRIHLPAGRRASIHSAVGQLSRFHHKGPVASKFAGSKPNGLSRVGCNVGGLGYCKLQTKLKTIAKLKAALRVIWGNLPRDRSTFDKAVKYFSKRLELAVDTLNIHSDNTEFWHLIISNC